MQFVGYLFQMRTQCFFSLFVLASYNTVLQRTFDNRITRCLRQSICDDHCLHYRCTHVAVILTCPRNPHERLGTQYSEQHRYRRHFFFYFFSLDRPTQNEPSFNLFKINYSLSSLSLSRLLHLISHLDTKQHGHYGGGGDSITNATGIIWVVVTLGNYNGEGQNKSSRQQQTITIQNYRRQISQIENPPRADVA